jgi:hypothetical protein
MCATSSSDRFSVCACATPTHPAFLFKNGGRKDSGSKSADLAFFSNDGYTVEREIYFLYRKITVGFMFFNIFLPKTGAFGGKKNLSLF